MKVCVEGGDGEVCLGWEGLYGYEVKVEVRDGGGEREEGGVGVGVGGRRVGKRMGRVV